ncbi:glycoside hydrolase family 11 protein [Parvularcula dongshanensis]|uniref:Endo-1,4-beta-xylanase n=1 Tax=Parvularcula dongshanensis TaxID=1173995 RepID=A0A840I3H3_9PROT|nr:glycoside hydrolase family 11 protein [Parvularcula dongshanensis]MBB4658852.1 endo-1,4-beta-xylanase [Parvularcula dongshanensis]
MLKRLSTLVAATVAPSLLLLGAPAYAQTQQVCDADATGTNSGFFYSTYYRKGSACLNMTDQYGGGNYGASWSLQSTGPVGERGDFVGGKGWATGSRYRTVGYNLGSWNPGNGWLALYGWTENPLVEYYVVDTWGEWRPTQGTRVGEVYSDGAWYDVYRNQRVNADSIVGPNQTFYQYWSIRRNKVSTGQNRTITFNNHATAWAAAGLPLGSTWRYQTLATEGYGSSGSANVTVWGQ